MADKIVRLRITKGYKKVLEGSRLDVVVKGGNSKPGDGDIDRALVEEYGMSLGEASGTRSHLDWEED
jgi:hypothetical protein